MPRITREVTVQAPPEVVYAAVADPAARARWLTSMRETPPEGPLRVGSRIPARRTAAGSRSQYELTVAVLDPPRRIETAIRRNGQDRGRGGYEIHPAAEGARVVSFAEYELAGLERLMGPAVEMGLRQEMEADLQSLKRHVETGAHA